MYNEGLSIFFSYSQEFCLLKVKTHKLGNKTMLYSTIILLVKRCQVHYLYAENVLITCNLKGKYIVYKVQLY